MLTQFLRRAGGPVLLQIGRRRASDEAERRKRARNQSGIGQRADAKHRLVALLDDVHIEVGQGKVDLHILVAPQVAGDCGNQALDAE